jgi:FkbM family methyltransferase
MSLFNKIAWFFYSQLPAENELLYQWCKRYVDRYRSENNGDIHHNGELEFMQSFMPHSQVVFDVGANTGEWAASALSINPDITIHCFEPSRETFARLLARDLSANGRAQNVIRQNIGFGASQEEKTLYIFEDESGMNSLYLRHGLEDGWGLATQQQTETIHLETLDRYCVTQQIARIDFLKIDVEGHEVEVFKGALDMLNQKRILAIQFEYGGSFIDSRILLKDIFEFFQPLDYSFYKIYPHRLQRVERYDQRLENFQYQNWAVLCNENRL